MIDQSPSVTYMEKIMRQVLEEELNKARDEIMSKASDEFSIEAQRILDTHIYRMVHNFTVTSREDPMRGRQELVIVLPESMMPTNKGGE